MRSSLMLRFTILVAGVVALAILSSVVAMITARRVAELMQRATAENVPSFRAAGEVEIALLMQNNALTLYVFGESSAERLRAIRHEEEQFHEWHQEAWSTVGTAEEKRLLEELDRLYSNYDAIRDRVIALRQQGKSQEAQRLLLNEVRTLYQEAHDVCERFVSVNQSYVEVATENARRQTLIMSWITAGFVVASLVLAGILVWHFFAGVVVPLRRVVSEAQGMTAAAGQERAAKGHDELRAVGDYMRELMADVTQSRSAVQESRRRAMISEKLAAVGKLAAGVAHEIRNPLTAIKMLLYAVQKAVPHEDSLDRKLRLVTEEIHRLETIVRNFLEFARPASLKVCRVPLRELLEKSTQLLEPQLARKHIRLHRNVDSCTDDVLVDPEQFRQVLLNLLENAMDAVANDGQIELSTTLETEVNGRRVFVVRVRDSGPGIAEDVRSRLFDPFVTTKEEGVGLGLCIAAQIVAAHGGRLVLESSTPAGSCFALYVPAAGERDDESNSGRG